MQMSSTVKQDWVQQIQQVLTNGIPFQYNTTNGNKIFVLFAADTFRRNGHRVCIDILPTESRVCGLIVTIFPLKNCIEITLRRSDDPVNIIQHIQDCNSELVSLRGCGTVIHTLFSILDWALHSGWYLDTTTMSTLSQETGASTQRNTALHVIIKKGSTY